MWNTCFEVVPKVAKQLLALSPLFLSIPAFVRKVVRNTSSNRVLFWYSFFLIPSVLVEISIMNSTLFTYIATLAKSRYLEKMFIPLGVIDTSIIIARQTRFSGDYWGGNWGGVSCIF